MSSFKYWFTSMFVVICLRKRSKLHSTICVCVFQVPLQSSSVDIVVFCLSLMGTNLVEYLCEASRVMKIGFVMN